MRRPSEVFRVSTKWYFQASHSLWRQLPAHQRIYVSKDLLVFDPIAEDVISQLHGVAIPLSIDAFKGWEYNIKLKKGRMLSLSNSLSEIEPFMTTLRFKRKFTGADIAKELSKKGIRWHHEDEVNSMIVNEILMQWGIRVGILD